MVTRIANPAYASTPTEAVSSEQRALCQEVANKLWHVFNWEASAEGMEFWNSVVRRLEEIANGEPLR